MLLIVLFSMISAMVTKHISLSSKVTPSMVKSAAIKADEGEWEEFEWLMGMVEDLEGQFRRISPNIDDFRVKLEPYLRDIDTWESGPNRLASFAVMPIGISRGLAEYPDKENPQYLDIKNRLDSPVYIKKLFEYFGVPNPDDYDVSDLESMVYDNMIKAIE